MNVGDELQYLLHDYSEPEVNTQWHLLWEGEEIIAVHKPANLPVSRTTRNIYNTLVQLVRRESEWPDAHLLHRLDLETSGIVLLAKNKQFASKWQPRLSKLMKRKIYHALVYGVPNWESRVFECALNTRSNSPIRCQMHVCDEGEVGKHSATRFTVLESLGDYSVVECELFTGRKHQIRAHLSSLGHPIVGDKIYAHQGEYYLKRIENKLSEYDEVQLKTPHHLLCAYQVELEVDPDATSETIIDQSYPLAWQKFIESTESD
jgi:23S rRNA pseudouridine1911/1915/1917 synthase